MNLKDIVVLSESPEDQALLDKVESAKDEVRATTKYIKYDDTAIEIISKVAGIADDLNIEELKSEVAYLEDAVFKAKNDLESAVYELEAPFEDAIRTLQNKIDDYEYDREYGTDESILSAMTRPLGEDPITSFPPAPSMIDSSIDAEFINWLKEKGKSQMFPYTLGDMNNPRTMELMKQMYHKETGQWAGDGGNRKYGPPGSERRGRGLDCVIDSVIAPQEGIPLQDDQETMIGVPNDWYNAEERIQAYKDLQNALQGNYMDDYIRDGDCPACGGSGYMDGEETFTNDDGEEEESSECDGFGNYGCDQGQMTYSEEEPSWVQIASQDKRDAQRQKAKANYPGDEAVIDFAASTAKQIKTSGGDPRDTLEYVKKEYPHMGRRQRADLVSQGMQKAGLTSEDIFSKHSDHPIAPGGQSSKRKNLHAVGDTVTLDNAKYTVTKVNLDTGTVDVKDASGKPLSNIKAGVFSVEGKSPHKKGTAKYKKHMAAMHAGESITSGPTKSNMRLKELSPGRDNSANEMKVAELIKKSIKDPKGIDAFELYAELQSENPELAELYKDVALHQYEVQLEEGITDSLKKGLVGATIIASLLGINALAPTAKDGDLGKALQAHVLASGEDSDLAKYYYNALDVYADAGDERTLINLNIKFNPDFETPRVKYDPNRTDVENFLRKQAKLPEPTNERQLKDVGGDDIVTVKMGGVDREFIRKGDMWDSTDPKYPMQFKVGSPTHKKLLNLVRTKQMARSTPSAQAKRIVASNESWTPKPAGKQYWWE